MQIAPEEIKNILIVRNDRFGEFLLNIPALRALKETFKKSRIIAVVDPYVKELAGSVPYIDEVVEWARVKHSLYAKLKFIRLLKSKKIDMAIILNPSSEFNLLTYLAGIPLRVGYDRKWGFLLTHKIEDRKYLGEKHEIEYNLDLVNTVAAKTNDRTLSLRLDEGIIDQLSKDLGIVNFDNTAVIHPWTSDEIKQWPLENFRDLAEMLALELDLNILVVGSKGDLQKSFEFFVNIGSGVINLTGRTSLTQLAAILSKAKLLISGDSGPVHLASCFNTPIIALFRNDIPGKNPARWGPLSRNSIVIAKSNLSDILVAEVFEKAMEALKR